MGTLSSELGGYAEALTDAPRIYGDANLPAGLVRFMRARLKWDVLFVIEEEQLRRARDIEHFRLAAQLRRTLLTLDRDYLDDIRFPPSESLGVVVLSAPRQDQLERLLVRVDRALFAPAGDGTVQPRTPLAGRKLHVHADWSGPAAGVSAG